MRSIEASRQSGSTLRSVLKNDNVSSKDSRNLDSNTCSLGRELYNFPTDGASENYIAHAGNHGPRAPFCIYGSREMRSEKGHVGD